ncbi:MAG TPA: iron-sulfur cluster assembly scaffold protein [Candidatus Dojkabacteria bacterium]|nr:iron-sulfur cluster assembly scaffold protein [Candidatus Dojkabacteria bacterium]
MKMQNPLYKQLIIDHYKNPKNFGNVGKLKLHNKVENASCGDVINVGMEIDDSGVVKSVAFDGSGCAISIASTSILLDSLKGKTLSDIKKIKSGDVLKMVGMEASSGRVKCALLSYEGIKEIVDKLDKAQ